MYNKVFFILACHSCWYIQVGRVVWGFAGKRYVGLLLQVGIKGVVIIINNTDYYYDNVLPNNGILISFDYG